MSAYINRVDLKALRQRDQIGQVGFPDAHLRRDQHQCWPVIWPDNVIHIDFAGVETALFEPCFLKILALMFCL